MTAQAIHPVAVPPAANDESPVGYASRLADWYAGQTTEGHRRKLGIYFTPQPIAEAMGRLCRNGSGHFVRILDPAAGTGTLGCAAVAALAASVDAPRHIELVCHEVEPALRVLLESAMSRLKQWVAARGIRFRYRILGDDFLLRHGEVLQEGLIPAVAQKFDAVICNPPYFKIGKSDPRARACSPVVHGQPNIYGLFMAVGAALLREGGRFAYITPRSFASGPYFSRFRGLFFRLIRPTDIHVFDSRTDAFADVLQETVITAGTRISGWERRRSGMRIRLTSSNGAGDIGAGATRTLKLSAVLRGGCEHRVLHFPASRMHDSAAATVGKWTKSLHAHGWEVSTGPVVAFRAREFLRSAGGRNAVPLLWLQNVGAMNFRWPAVTRKPQYVVSCHASANVLLPNRNYVLLRRFSAKEDPARITAAPYLARSLDHPLLGLENHLNYIHKPGGELSADETFGLAAILGSRLIDTYFRISSGNTQVSATELRTLPLPELATIRRIGARVRANLADCERIVAESLGDAR